MTHNLPIDSIIWVEYRKGVYLQNWTYIVEHITNQIGVFDG